MLIQLMGWGFISLIVVILLIDIVPIFRDWLCRIKIGKNQDKARWNKSITNIGVKWLNKTPKVRVTDNTRLIALDMLNRNYTRGTIQHWQEASLVLGLVESLRNNDDDKNARCEINKFLLRKFNENGQWKKKPLHVDGAIMAYAIMKIDFVDTNKYKRALDYTWDLIKDNIGEDGTVGYRKSMMCYRYVDTIGFICPFLVSYGVKYNKRECTELAIKQIKDYVQFGMLDDYFIPNHAYTVKDKTPLGLYGWGRGLGWFALGLIDTWRELPDNNAYKIEIEKIVSKFAKAAMVFQQKDGSWNWTVTRQDCRADSSSTAMLSWFLLNAAKINGISEDCINSVEKAIEYIISVTRRNGVVDFSQGDTKDLGVYSMLFNILPFTQGFCIRVIHSYTRLCN